MDGHAIIAPWRARRALWDRGAQRPRPKLPVVVDADGGRVHCGEWSCYVTKLQASMLLAMAGAYPEAATYAEIDACSHGTRTPTMNARHANVCNMRIRLAAERAPFEVRNVFGLGFLIVLATEGSDDGSRAA